MQKLTYRTRIVFILFLLVSLFITYFGIYKPMNTEIRSNLLENYKLLAEAKTSILKERINKSIQGATSLSSRTMIKTKIVDYKMGKVTFNELKEYTEEKYEDGVSVFEDLSFAQRLVDHKIVATIEREDTVFRDYTIDTFSDKVQATILVKGKNDYLEVISPIVDNSEILGYDILGFRLNNLIEELNKGNIRFEILKGNASEINKGSSETIHDNKGHIYYYETIDKTTVLSLSISKDVHFKKINEITNEIIINVIIGYFLMILLIHFVLIKFANQKINSISMDRDLYKDYALLDNLTGALSRLYLSKYVQNNPENSCILVLIDLDNFKCINDNYGHVIGDGVLITITEVFKDSLRDNDLIVRFGGDEFIILFDDLEIDKADIIIQRVKRKLSKINKFEFIIDFSYGVVKVEKVKKLYEYIEKVDKSMYKNKKDKKCHT